MPTVKTLLISSSTRWTAVIAAVVFQTSLSMASPNGPVEILNPLVPETIARVKQVVIGLDEGRDGLTVIETIDDAYRLGRLKKRVVVPALTKRPNEGTAGHRYYLLFLNDQDQIVAA